jgi:hypothetical protein
MPFSILKSNEFEIIISGVEISLEILPLFFVDICATIIQCRQMNIFTRKKLYFANFMTV